ncbi:MAG: helix-turn-helix domain-containing protein [Nitrospiraceae bacterium]|nr:helix-turn-helix domain-containing protein [Nitrospiraceae bacterium]
MNKTKDDYRVSIKELAELIGISTDTIRRAFRKGEIPAIRVKTALRFDLNEVLLYMQRNAEARYGRNPRAAGGDRRPRAEVTSPRTGNTGAQTTEIIPGGLQSR